MVMVALAIYTGPSAFALKFKAVHHLYIVMRLQQPLNITQETVSYM